jgi:hypothetical protein
MKYSTISDVCMAVSRSALYPSLCSTVVPSLEFATHPKLPGNITGGHNFITLNKCEKAI